MSEQTKASTLFVRALEHEGVEFIFGIPGEENIPLLGALQHSKMRLVVTRHEQAAGFMAATVGRLTGKAGVALSTLGPGATNFTTAISYANLGGMPAVFVTGQKPIMSSKQGLFQILNVVEHFRSICKRSCQIVSASLVPVSVRESFRVAGEEKPGATTIEFAEDISEQVTTNTTLFESEPERRPVPDVKSVLRAVELLHNAKCPLIVIGGGANRKRTSNALSMLVNECELPFAATQMGKGVISEDHELFLGVAALSSNDYVHVAVEQADVILIVGHDPTEKPPFFMSHGDGPTVIHVNYTSAVVDQIYHPQLSVIGDIGNAVWEIKERLKGHQGKWREAHERLKLVARAQARAIFEQRVSEAWPMNPVRVVTDMRAVLPDNAIVCLDNGLYKLTFARSYAARERNTVLLDNALATMGAGLPSAIAAKLVHPELSVTAVCGDGGFMMNSQELATALRCSLDLVVIVFNDNAYGMIQWKQKAHHYENFGLDLNNPDFVAYAKAYGANAWRCKSPSHFKELFQNCHAKGGVHLIEVPISYKDYGDYLTETLPRAVNKLREEMAAGGKCATFCDDDKAEHVEKQKVSEEKNTTANISAIESADSVLEKTYPYYLAGMSVWANEDLEVLDKYSGSVATRVALADEAAIDRAITAADGSRAELQAMPPYKRKNILLHVAKRMTELREKFAIALCIEAGKPLKDARGEVTRGIDTFTIAAEEAVRIHGEWSSLEISERARGYQSVTRRFPIGTVSLVSPFNFPINLLAHKIAPAIAAGCPWVAKPASRTPISALMLGALLQETELPRSSWSILPCSRDGADLFTVDERFKLLSFTGSPGVGWALKAKAGKKKVTLELGGNAAVIIDDLDQTLETIVNRVVIGGLYQSGQSCISVQRILVRKAHYETVRDALVVAMKKLKCGDPRDESVFIGPMISENEAKRLHGWIDAAVTDGATLLCGGKLAGSMLEPTLLEHVPKHSSAWNEEAFGPLMCIRPYDTFEEAVCETNDSTFGLQAGIFTSNLHRSQFAFEHIEAGGVVINDVPSIRVDSQAYGGVKDSGLGREGLRYAIEDMTELRVLITKHTAILPLEN